MDCRDMPYIVSAVPGRLRIRAPGFDRDEIADAVCQALCRQLPVAKTRVNTGASSIVIHYDDNALPRLEAEASVERIVASFFSAALAKAGASRRRSGRMRLNRIAKIGALASLSASMVSAYSGSRKMHIYTGWIFLACLGVHLGVFRRSLTH